MGKYANLLRDKRIFLTGSTGLFGKWLLTELQELNAELVILTRNPEAFRKSFPLVESMTVNFVKGDIRDFNSQRVVLITAYMRPHRLFLMISTMLKMK